MKKFTIKVYDNDTGELIANQENAVTETDGFFLLAQHEAEEETTGVFVKAAIDPYHQNDGNRNAFIRGCFRSVISRLEAAEEDFAEVQAFTISEFMHHLEKNLGPKVAAAMCLHMAEQLAKKAVEAGEE